jgi:hypothetical protein
MWRALGLFLALSLPVALPAGAEVRAVLIGVGDYLTLDADLQGPPHDVALMAGVLLDRGLSPDAITVLTTDPAPLPPGLARGAPTRAAILAALRSAAAASSPGDTLVFYFSGHGAQAPDLSGDEGGGHDEILLPADAAGWTGATQSVTNAILDDELLAWAKGALDRGVRVVGLIDACHSATGFRALGGEGVARVVDEGLLGIPADVVPVAGDPVPPLAGDFVFLYSSQSDQRSFEYPLADGSAWHGEFTLRLAQTLRAAPDASWAQVLAATREAMVQGPARQMPDGEGPLLNAPVFGQGQAGARWPVTGDRLKAGLLDGLAEGAEVALYAEPAGGAPLAILPLGKVTAREASLPGTLPRGAAWAELVAAPPPATLTLAAPVRADPGDGFDYTDWLAALPAPGPRPDLVPILTGGTVALAGADGVLDPAGPGSTPRIRPEAGETPGQALARTLDQAAHGLRLRSVLSGAAGRSLTGTAPLTMSIERRAADPACGSHAAPAPHDPAQGVVPCDQLWLTLTNTGGKAQDVSVLYFAADFAVTPIWPAQNLANRLAPGESLRVGLMIEPASPPGLEEIWVLAVPVDPDAPRVDLTGLASPATLRDLAQPSDMATWIGGRLDPDSRTRGFSLKPAPLTMLRQMVRLATPPDTPAIIMEN